MGQLLPSCRSIWNLRLRSGQAFEGARPTWFVFFLNNVFILSHWELGTEN